MLGSTRKTAHFARCQCALLIAFVAAAGCLYPEPIEQDPGPTNVDSAPSIVAVSPTDGIEVPQSLGGKCQITDLKLTEVSAPQGQTLYGRLYLNNELSAPLQVHGAGPYTFQLSQSYLTEDDFDLYAFDDPIDLTSLATQLNAPDSDEPNLLTVYVSDGFADTDSASASPKAAVGSYTTSYTWGLDLSACDPIFQSLSSP